MKTTIVIFLISGVLASAQNYRVVDGKTYDSSSWPQINDSGAMIKVVQDTPNGTVCEVSQVVLTYSDLGQRQYDPRHIADIVVKNYPSQTGLVTDQYLPSVHAMKTGRIQTAFGTLEVYDCGTLYIPPAPIPLTPEQVAVFKAKSASAKKSGDEKALASNQDAAAKGDAYGLLRMGERYRDGDGVAKDLLKARDYLARSAAAGSPSAQVELDAISK